MKHKNEDVENQQQKLNTTEEAPDKKPADKKTLKGLWIVPTVLLALCVVIGGIWAITTGGFTLSANGEDFIGHMTEPGTVTVSEDTVVSVELNDTAKADMATTLAEVFFDAKKVFDCKTGKSLLVEEIYEGRTAAGYTMVDMNQDGTKEVIVKLADDKANTISYVLIQTENGVWGLELSAEELSMISTTGIFYVERAAGASDYFRLETTEDKVTSKQIASDTGLDCLILEEGQKEMTPVSREQFVRFVNAQYGTVAMDYKAYDEETLKKDLENPLDFACTVEMIFGPEYWSGLVCELPQYNKDMGKTLTQFLGRDVDVYTNDARWTKEAETVLYCSNLDKMEVIGTDNSIYQAEYVGVVDDMVVMIGAATDPGETLAMDFLVEDTYNIEPAVFEIHDKTGKATGTDVLLWSCGDTYLAVSCPSDTREEDFYNRPVTAICYCIKEYCGVTQYPIVKIPDMSLAE